VELPIGNFSRTANCRANVQGAEGNNFSHPQKSSRGLGINLEFDGYEKCSRQQATNSRKRVYQTLTLRTRSVQYRTSDGGSKPQSELQRRLNLHNILAPVVWCGAEAEIS